MKKFKVIFMTDKREEIDVTGDTWAHLGEGELEISNQEDEPIAWFRNVVGVIELE